MDNKKTGISGVSGNLSKKNKKSRLGTYLCIASVSFFVILIIIFIISENTPRNNYLKDLRVSTARVAEKSMEDNKYYIRLESMRVGENEFVSVNDPWVEVNSVFFNLHDLNSDVGLLLGNYDVFKLKSLNRTSNKGQSFEKNIWAIEETYDSYASAVSANPDKSYVGKATLIKKKTLKNGEAYFILDNEGRQFNIKVSKDVFSKYKLNSQVQAEFKAIGDFVKIVKVVE